MSPRFPAVWCRIVLAALLLSGIGAEAHAQNGPNRPAVDLFWKHTATIRIPGVSQATVLDETICQVERSDDEVRLTGVMVGDTVVLLWIDGVRTAMVVRVTPQPDQPAASRLSAQATAAIGEGRVGSTAMVNTSSDTTPLVTHEYWDWRQNRDGARLSVHGLNDTYTGRSHAFNLSSLGVQYAKREWTLSLMDFALNIGLADTPTSPLAQYGAFSVRGADYVATRGRTRVEVFAGSTVPSYFLSFADTRTLGGFKVDREISPGFGLFVAAGAVNAPPTLRAQQASRSVMPFSVTGATYRPSPRVSLKASGGASRQGFMADAQADYTRGRFAGSLAASDAAAAFPLNQVQLLTTSEAAVRAMGTLQWSNFSMTTTARHAVAKPNGLAILRGSSDSIAQSLQFSLPLHQHVSANASRSVSTGSVLTASSTTRYDGSWSSPLSRRAANTLQIGTGQVRETSELNSFREFTFRDSGTLSLPFGSIALAFEHQRLDPSIPSRIRQVIDVLPPQLQDLFQLDPVRFLLNVDVPADIRQLLERVQPTSSSLSIGGNFSRRRMTVSPTFSAIRDTLTGDASRLNYILGYSATWQLGSTWQLRSALSNQIFYSRAAAGFHRTNVFTIGLDKQLHGLPRWLPVAPKYAVEGHVFRDSTVDGVFGPGKPGFGGVVVRLDDGRVATTDKTGHFRFGGVAPGLRHVSLDLAQFRGHVRVTTPTEADIEVTDRAVQVHFGVVDFARLLGTLFNDYRNDGNRQSDAPGLAGVLVRARSESFSTEIRTDGSGDYAIDDLPPGDYTVTIVAADLPSDYVMGAESQRVHVDPLATAILDIPVRALRSISGRVVFKRDGVLEPLEGVVITAGDATSTTDAEGRFTLRVLPAGAIEVRVMPVRPVPERLHLPFGVLRMKMDPARVENANVIITNPELIEYITTSQAAQVSQK